MLRNEENNHYKEKIAAIHLDVTEFFSTKYIEQILAESIIDPTQINLEQLKEKLKHVFDSVLDNNLTYDHLQKLKLHFSPIGQENFNQFILVSNHLFNLIDDLMNNVDKFAANHKFLFEKICQVDGLLEAIKNEIVIDQPFSYALHMALKEIKSNPLNLIIAKDHPLHPLQKLLFERIAQNDWSNVIFLIKKYPMLVFSYNENDDSYLHILIKKRDALQRDNGPQNEILALSASINAYFKLIKQFPRDIYCKILTRKNKQEESPLSFILKSPSCQDLSENINNADLNEMIKKMPVSDRSYTCNDSLLNRIIETKGFFLTQETSDLLYQDKYLHYAFDTRNVSSFDRFFGDRNLVMPKAKADCIIKNLKIGLPSATEKNKKFFSQIIHKVLSLADFKENHDILKEYYIDIDEISDVIFQSFQKQIEDSKNKVHTIANMLPVLCAMVDEAKLNEQSLTEGIFGRKLKTFIEYINKQCEQQKELADCKNISLSLSVYSFIWNKDKSDFFDTFLLKRVSIFDIQERVAQIFNMLQYSEQLSEPYLEKMAGIILLSRPLPDELVFNHVALNEKEKKCFMDNFVRLFNYAFIIGRQNGSPYNQNFTRMFNAYLSHKEIVERLLSALDEIEVDKECLNKSSDNLLKKLTFIFEIGCTNQKVLEELAVKFSEYFIYSTDKVKILDRVSAMIIASKLPSEAKCYFALNFTLDCIAEIDNPNDLLTLYHYLLKNQPFASVLVDDQRDKARFQKFYGMFNQQNFGDVNLTHTGNKIVQFVKLRLVEIGSKSLLPKDAEEFLNSHRKKAVKQVDGFLKSHQINKTNTYAFKNYLLFYSSVDADQEKAGKMLADKQLKIHGWQRKETEKYKKGLKN